MRAKTALVVDDHKLNLQILTRQLEFWGMVVCTAASAGEAVKYLEERTVFDCGILDMQMPGIDGSACMRDPPAQRL